MPAVRGRFRPGRRDRLMSRAEAESWMGLGAASGRVAVRAASATTSQPTRSAASFTGDTESPTGYY